jgi:hypothetical protein
MDTGHAKSTIMIKRMLCNLSELNRHNSSYKEIWNNVEINQCRITFFTEYEFIYFSHSDHSVFFTPYKMDLIASMSDT